MTREEMRKQRELKKAVELMNKKESSAETNTAGSRNRAECEVAMGNKYLDGTALTLVIIGALNWLLIGIFRFDLVAFIFGNMTWFSRIVYGIVGLCGLYLISFYMHLGSRNSRNQNV